MKRTRHFLGWATLVGVLLSVALVFAAISLTGAMDGTTIQYNGDPWTLAEPGTGHWFVAIGGIALALLIVVLVLLTLALVVPLAVLIPLATTALLALGALIVAVSVLAIALSPLILMVLVVWSMVRLVRRGNAKNCPASGAMTTV